MVSFVSALSCGAWQLHRFYIMDFLIQHAAEWGCQEGAPVSAVFALELVFRAAV